MLIELVPNTKEGTYELWIQDRCCLGVFGTAEQAMDHRRSVYCDLVKSRVYVVKDHGPRAQVGTRWRVWMRCLADAQTKAYVLPDGRKAVPGCPEDLFCDCQRTDAGALLECIGTYEDRAAADAAASILEDAFRTPLLPRTMTRDQRDPERIDFTTRSG